MRKKSIKGGKRIGEIKETLTSHQAFGVYGI